MNYFFPRDTSATLEIFISDLVRTINSLSHPLPTKLIQDIRKWCGLDPAIVPTLKDLSIISIRTHSTLFKPPFFLPQTLKEEIGPLPSPSLFFSEKILLSTDLQELGKTVASTLEKMIKSNCFFRITDGVFSSLKDKTSGKIKDVITMAGAIPSDNQTIEIEQDIIKMSFLEDKFEKPIVDIFDKHNIINYRIINEIIPDDKWLHKGKKIRTLILFTDNHCVEKTITALEKTTMQCTLT